MSWNAIWMLFVLISCLQTECSPAEGNNVNAAVPVKNKKSKSGLKCPALGDIPFDFFPLPCTSHSDCKLMGSGYLCCGREAKILRCTKGVRGGKPRSNNIRITLPVVPAVPVSIGFNDNNVENTITTKATTTTTTTTTTKKPTTTATTTTTTTTTIKTPKKVSDITLKNDVICPNEKDIPFQLFVIRCTKKHSECQKSLGPDFLCCNKRCIRGIVAPATEQDHDPIFGIIPRECPVQPLGELLFDTQPCETDTECWPRICCPDGPRRYCRTAMPRFDLVPATRNFNTPLHAVTSYLQCSPSPPKAFDLFPKSCNTSLDCFPNLCCQENGNKYCRPARKSLLALIAGVTQNRQEG